MYQDRINFKRLLIFFFYDKDGIVDKYVTYMLEDIKKCVTEILIVVNGNLTDTGTAAFKRITSNVMIRENVGFDVWAYKAGLEYVSREKKSDYDEIIMMNFTVMGPLYPFSEMFKTMEQREVDFWGVTMFHEVPYDPFGKISLGYIPLHLQSHFIAVRRNMFMSDKFVRYWEDLPSINSYEESICFHEVIFTKTFDDYGFKWDVYVDTRSGASSTMCPIMMEPVRIIRDFQCPLFKRKSFFHEYSDFMNNCTAEVSKQLLVYIENHTEYDIDMIWENILRTQNQLDFNRVMGLNFVLPTNVRLHDNKDGVEKVALIFHMYFEDLIEYCTNYVLSMPSTADIFITTDTEQKKTKILLCLKNKINEERFRVLIVKNRGRDVSSLLVAGKDIVNDYDFVCFAHDKKGPPMTYGTVSNSFANKCYENTMASQIFVENVIVTFKSNPRLGILSPPAPIHADYYCTVGQVDWEMNFEIVKDIAKKLNIKSDISFSKASVAPLGTIFWFRSKALKSLFDYGWTYNDFPKEPAQTDATILHAIERIYPLVAQDAGFYPARLYSDSYLPVELANLDYYLKTLTKAAFEKYGADKHYHLVKAIRHSRDAETMSEDANEIDRIFRFALKQKLKRIVPRRFKGLALRIYRLKWVNRWFG